MQDTIHDMWKSAECMLKLCGTRVQKYYRMHARILEESWRNSAEYMQNIAWLVGKLQNVYKNYAVVHTFRFIRLV